MYIQNSLLPTEKFTQNTRVGKIIRYIYIYIRLFTISSLRKNKL